MQHRSIKDARLAEAVDRLVEGLHPRAIILFGSRARGTDRAGSDYDLQALLLISTRLARYHAIAARRGYSITSSARASSVGGTSMPSALAVFRLMTSSYLVGA
jgi:hypothetical protein